LETLETERQRVEEKVRKLSSAVEQSIDGIAIGDLEPKLTYVNSAFAWMHGYSPEEMVGMPIVSLHNEEQMDEYQRSMAQIKTQGSWIGEIGHVRKDGTPFPTFMSATLLKDDDGKPTGILALVRDITEQKQAELGLKESQERYRTLIENLPQKIFHKDRKSVYISCNANYAQDLGVRPIEIIGKTDFDFYPKDLAEKYRADDRRVIESGQVEIIEERYIQHGEERLVQTFKAPVKDSEGNVTGVLGIFHDITEHKRMEEALRESEEKLSLMFESVSEGIIVTDLWGNIIQLNEAVVRMAGCDDKKELIGRSAFDFIAEEDRARAMENLKRTLEHGFRSAVQYTLVRKDGGRYTAELNAALMRDKSGSPVGFVAVITDITERKQVEETLRESERNYRVLFESTLDGMMVIDAETLKIVLGNQAAARMYGFDSPEDAIGLDPLDFIPPEDRERVIKIMAEDMFEKDLRRVNEFRTITKDGREIWLSAVGTRIEYQGRLAGLVSFRDITEHKRMEKALRESERRYRLLAENTTDVISCVDMNLRPTYMSPSITRLLGYTVEESMARGVEGSLTPASREVITDAMSREMAMEQKERGSDAGLRMRELEFYRKDGSTVWVEVMVSFLRDSEGRPVEILSVLRDITDRRRAEEALRTVLAQTERMNATATLAAGVAHELNNPMMGMLNFAQYCLKHTSEDDRRYPVLQDIERETKRCVDIVDNLLTFSRTGREGEEEYRKDSLATVIDQVVRLLSYRIEKEHVVVTYHIAEGTPEIWMRMNSMQQVFLNLVNNALDALKNSQKKEIQVEVRGEDDFVQVTVADSGCGIAPENLGKIFTPFFTTKHTGQGTGLGLPISESIIREHGGKITCESKLGAGTKFIILLPIERKVGKETAR
jgi:PAS domain S-box-containing protein